MNKKARKGEFAYHKQKTQFEIIKTVVFFGISASLFIAGYAATKTNANILTVAAVLGCLPASKSAVSMIMHLKAKGCSVETAEQIQERFGKEMGAYNLYFTSYDKNFDISHVVVEGLTIAAFTENSKTDEKAFEEHIKNILMQDGIKGYNVKLFKDCSKYMDRVEQMLNLENEKGRETDVINTLFSVSL